MTCLESHNPSGLRIECRAAHTFYIVFTGTLDLVQQWRICNTQFMVFKESISLQPQSTHIRNESPGNDHGHSMRLRRTQILLILLGKHFFFFLKLLMRSSLTSFLGDRCHGWCQRWFGRKKDPRMRALRCRIKFASLRTQDLRAIILGHMGQLQNSSLSVLIIWNKHLKKSGERERKQEWKLSETRKGQV